MLHIFVPSGPKRKTYFLHKGNRNRDTTDSLFCPPHGRNLNINEFELPIWERISSSECQLKIIIFTACVVRTVCSTDNMSKNLG